MKKKAGIWIDHNKAVIVIVSDQGEEIKEITSNMEKYVRFTDEQEADTGSIVDLHDRQFENHFNIYYERIVDTLRGVDSIHVFGPGEAKGELQKRLENSVLRGRVLANETIDIMTDRQISAKIREQLSV